ncbi:CoA transferase, partial [Streptomyces lasiicapitis]|uniref:CoA transferase n=1 Tax=Streptomyces lasiicapitis TaxID=1923961 RepID=UPI00365A68A6
MTSPPLTTAQTTARPLEALRCDIGGPPELTRVVAEHLRLLGAETHGTPGDHEFVSASDERGAASAHVALAGAGFSPVTAEVLWAEPEGAASRDAVASGQRDAVAPGSHTPAPHRLLPAQDEPTVQAATGIMAVHGRRDGAPRGLGADYAATAAGVLAVQGLLAQLLAQARGGEARAAGRVGSPAAPAGVLAVSHYLAA